MGTFWNRRRERGKGEKLENLSGMREEKWMKEREKRERGKKKGERKGE